MSDDYTRLPSDEQAFELPEPNPITAELRRKGFRRQILAPILIGTVLLVGICVLFWQLGVGSVARWASISTIFMMLPVLLVGLLILGILVASVLALGELMKILPRYTRFAQDAVKQLQAQIEAGADLSTKPIIQIKGYLAFIERLFGFSKKD